MSDHTAPPSLDARKGNVSQTITLQLYGPQNRAVFWALTFLYSFSLIAFSNMAVFFVALMTLPYRNPNPEDNGRQTLWLWVVGMVAAALVIGGARNFKPEGMSFYTWWSDYPAETILSIAGVTVAAVVMLWHVSWYREPGQEEDKRAGHLP